MSRVPVLALPVALLLALAAVPLTAATAITGDGATSEIVLDVPPDYVRYGADVPVSGTVFGVDGRRAAKNPVAVATWDATLEQFVWGKTVTTDANGRFRTSVRANGTTGDNTLLAPLLNAVEGAADLVEQRLPTVKLQYPVTVKVAKDPKDPANVVVSGTTPECEGAELELQVAYRSAFTPYAEPITCLPGTDKFSVTVARPVTGTGLTTATWAYRVVRPADDLTVPTVSAPVSFR
ncbi:MAG: hypothetical protein JWM64_253 [Frankiales bacterium]|nr:hypothetical protein [Frankiales bacterium]